MSKRVYLDPLVPKVRRCNICQRFGHLAQFCRSGLRPDKSICARCGEKGHFQSSCSGSPKCINCIRSRCGSIDHEASSFTCPTFLREKGLKIIMARYNVLRSEAEDIYDEFDGVPRRGWTLPSMHAPPPLVLGDFVSPQASAASSFARAASGVPPAADGSRRHYTPFCSSQRHPSRDHGWPPIIPHPPYSSKSSHSNLSASFVAGNLTPASLPVPSSPRPSRFPLYFHGNYNSTQGSHFARCSQHTPSQSTQGSAPSASLKTAALLPLIKSKFSEKFAAEIQLSDTSVVNLITTIVEVIVNS